MNKKIDFLKFNQSEFTTYPNLQNIIKAVLAGKFRALSAYRNKLEKSHTNNLKAHLEALAQNYHTTIYRPKETGLKGGCMNLSHQWKQNSRQWWMNRKKWVEEKVRRDYGDGDRSRPVTESASLEL